MDKQKQIAIVAAVVILVALAILVIFLFTGGGGNGEVPTTTAPPPPGGFDISDMGFAPQPPSPAPSMAPAPTPPSAPTTQVAVRPRPDPFAPLPEEVEAMQGEAFNPNQFFLLASPPEPPKVELPEPYEPQPRRRVAGIIIGPTVSAILEQEGEPIPLIVQPGDTVGEFRVVSISDDGLILRRPTGNPREVRVPYEPPGAGFTSGGGGFSGGPPGGAGVPGPPGFAPPGRGGRGGGGPEY